MFPNIGSSNEKGDTNPNPENEEDLQKIAEDQLNKIAGKDAFNAFVEVFNDAPEGINSIS